MRKSRLQVKRDRDVRIDAIKRKVIRDVAYFLFCGLVFTGLMKSAVIGLHKAQQSLTDFVGLLVPVSTASTKQIVSPLPMAFLTPTQTPTPTPIPDETTIDGYITKVFGNSTSKAMELLQCENASHDPDRVNTAGNHPAGSRDIGVFQVNEYWQDVNPKYLFNWKINILIAKQLYDENSQTFDMWTCGKNLGI